MRAKKFTCGVTFFVTPEMYQDLKQLSDERQVAISELLRDWIAEAFERGRLKLQGPPGDKGKGDTKERNKRDGNACRIESV
mgnify:CR=1 FL=1